MVGAVLAVPTGASANAGDGLLLGRGNQTVEQTSVTYTGRTADPGYGAWNWSDRDWDYGTGTHFHGGVSTDALWVWNGIYSVQMTTNAVWAQNDGSAEIMHVENNNLGPAIVAKTPAAAQPAVAAQNTGAGPGLVASSAKGSQMRLQPSTTTHPKTGVIGDLFLDKVGKLWFCQGGTKWKQLA